MDDPDLKGDELVGDSVPILEDSLTYFNRTYHHH